MVQNNSSGALLLGNTSEMNSEELKSFISLSEEINERKRLSDQHSAINALPRAHLKRQEIFECSVIDDDDDKFLSALEHQNSFFGSTQITDLDVTQSIENILKYFDEEVNYRSSNSSTPTLQQIGNRVTSVVAKLKSKTIKLTTTAKNEQSIKYPSVKALKAKYEPTTIQPNGVAEIKQVNKNSTVKNVKQMAQMFNNKISQIINPKPYAQLENEFSPEPKPMPKLIEKKRPNLTIYKKAIPVASPNLKRKTQEPKPAEAPKTNVKVRAKFPIYRDHKASPVASPISKRKMQLKDNAACIVTEEIFQQLSVKDKALLYQKFIEDMSVKSTEFKQHAEQLEQHVRNQFNDDDDGVIVEKQQKVKQIARQIEAKMGVPRQTFSDTSLQYMPQYKTLPNQKLTSEPVEQAATEKSIPTKAKEAEDAMQNNGDFMHISEIKVYLKKPNKTIFSPEHLTQVTSMDEEEIGTTFKRGNNLIRHTYSTEAYAPPKKIRRTRDERLTPKTIFQNTEIESMFYVWLKQKNGVSFDIKNQNSSIKDESEEKNDTAQLSTNSLETTLDWSNNITLDWSNNITLDKTQDPVKNHEIKSLNILNRELPPLESPRLCQILEKPVEELKKELKINNEMKIKRQAPPIPTNSTKERTSSESSSSCKPSEMEESESNAKCTTDDSQPEQQCSKTTTQAEKTKEKQDDFVFIKPTRPPRKKKLRRTLTWKKENSIVESTTLASTTTDSDSDRAAGAKKKNTTFAVQKAMKKCNNQLKKLIFSSANNIKEQINYKEQSINELNKSLLKVLYSPRKIRSAYTLTVLTSPSPYTESEQGDPETLRNSSIYRETSRSLPSIGTAIDDEDFKSNDFKSASMEMSENQQHVNRKKSITDSLTDQGFETGSNEMENSIHKQSFKREKSKSPLFFKLYTKQQQQNCKRDSSDSACESPANCSTPFKNYGQECVSMNQNNAGYLSPISQSGPAKPRRRILTDAENRRSSLAMQVIREDQPLDISETHNITKLPVDKNEINSEKISNFWITAGEFTTSVPIYYNTPDRVRLLLDIFCQKSNDSGDWHFGIDDHKFTINKPDEQECISKRLPGSKDISHYWFSTGDLAVPFNGKYLHPTKILRLFKFIRESFMDAKDAPLRFGIDEFEFSKIPENLSVSPKFSLESNYSSCLRLQSYDDGRKYSWTNNSNIIKNSYCNQSEHDVEASDSSRMSITPMSCHSTGYNSPSGRDSENGSPFRFSFGNESLDKLFEHKNKVNNQLKI